MQAGKALENRKLPTMPQVKRRGRPNPEERGKEGFIMAHWPALSPMASYSRRSRACLDSSSVPKGELGLK